MRIKIQNTKEGVKIHERWTQTDIINKDTVHAHKKECARVIMLVGIFMKMFTRFKEVIINTELTEDD